jgi:hypothetical protein
MIALFIFGGYSYLCFAKTVPCKAKAIVGFSIVNTVNSIHRSTRRLLLASSIAHTRKSNRMAFLNYSSELEAATALN